MKDFDYVDFKDYKSDMDELATQASDAVTAIKQELDREKRDKNRIIAAIVFAAGGRVEITGRHLMMAYDAEIRQWRDEANKVTVLEAAPMEPE